MPISTAMNLARHSDPSLTLKTYGHVSATDRRVGVETAAIKLPAMSTDTPAEPLARKRIRKCAAHTAPHPPAQPCTTTDPETTPSAGPDSITKWLNRNRFCIEPHGDARPCMGPEPSTPQRTRTFNPLVVSQPENGSNDIGKGDFSERVCRSVSKPIGLTISLERLVEIARFAGNLSAVEQEALVAMLEVVGRENNR